MAKFCGEIGFAAQIEERPGVWIEDITTRKYYGDVLQNNRRLSGTNQVNDNITVGNRISIIADPYANENFYAMRYCVFNGVKWKVDNVEVQFPRLILSLGGVYNDDSGE